MTIAEVVDIYQVGLARHKGDIPLSVGLVELLRKKQDVLPARLRDTAQSTADTAINRMVEVHGDNPEAYLARYRYRKAYKIEGADEDLIQAYSLDPDGVEVLLAALVAKTPVDHEAARKYGTSCSPSPRRSPDLHDDGRHFRQLEPAGRADRNA